VSRPTRADVRAAEAAALFNGQTTVAMQARLREAESRAAVLEQRLTKSENANVKMATALENVEDYFANKMDADTVDGELVPNREMRLYTMCREARGIRS